MSVESISLENEIWKPVLGYESLYFVSNGGLIKAIKSRRGKSFLTPTLNRYGYYYVSLSQSAVTKKKSLHRIVLEAFIGLSDLPIDHLNGIKTDNRLENLEYVTSRVNTQRAYLRVLNKECVGVLERPNSRWSASINYNGKRYKLGAYDTEREAYEIYRKAVLQIEKNDFDIIQFRKEINPNILDDERVWTIYNEPGCASKTLAKKYGVSYCTVYNIKKLKYPYNTMIERFMNAA